METYFGFEDYSYPEALPPRIEYVTFLELLDNIKLNSLYTTSDNEYTSVLYHKIDLGKLIFLGYSFTNPYEYDWNLLLWNFLPMNIPSTINSICPQDFIYNVSLSHNGEYIIDYTNDTFEIIFNDEYENNFDDGIIFIPNNITKNMSIYIEYPKIVGVSSYYISGHIRPSSKSGIERLNSEVLEDLLRKHITIKLQYSNNINNSINDTDVIWLDIDDNVQFHWEYYTVLDFDGKASIASSVEIYTNIPDSKLAQYFRILFAVNDNTLDDYY